MQLLYGNDGINYRMIDKSPEMTDGIQKTLLSTYSKYEFVSNSNIYSSRAKEPEAVTYVTSNLDNQLSDDQVIVCKAGHMRNFSSPSYYFHCVMKKVSNDFYKKDFFQIFSYKFIEDLDVGQYGDGKIDGYSFPSVPVQANVLTDEQLTVIIASFMANERKSCKTRIIVDAVGDEYNERSREILASIYRYLPYELRKRYGFKTYCQEDKNLPARISFILFNRDEMKEDIECLTLDKKVSDIEGTVDRQYIDYAEYLVKELDDAGREKHFDSLSKLVKNGRLSIQDCITYYSNYKSWAEGDQEELLPEWIQYVDQNSFRKGALYELMVEIIASKVDNEYYNTYLFENILKLYNETIYNLSPNAAKTIRFADCVEGIAVSPERFHEWYFTEFQKKLNSQTGNGKGGEREKKKILEEEIERLETVDIMSDQLKKLLEQEAYYLKRLKDSYSGQVQEAQERELEDVNRHIRALARVDIRDFADIIKAIRKSIEFPENLEMLALSVEEWIDDRIPAEITSDKELNIWTETLEKLSDILPEEKTEIYRSKFQRYKDKLEEEKKAKVFELKKGSVLSSYRSLCRGLENGTMNQEDWVEVILNGYTEDMRAETLEAVLSFILEPTKESGSMIRDYLWDLLEEDILGADHFEYLIRLIRPEEEQAVRLIDYYYDEERPEKISEKYMADMIVRYHPELERGIVRLLEEEERFDKLCKYLRCASRSFQRSAGDDDTGLRRERLKKKTVFGNFGGGRDRR